MPEPFGKAFDGQSTGVGAVEALGQRPSGVVRSQDFACRGGTGQARGEVHRVAGDCVFAMTGTAGAARDHLSGSNAHMNADLAADTRRHFRYLGLDRQRCTGRPLRIVAVRDRGAKHPHDAVADVLVDMSAVLQDDAVGATEELLDQRMQLFGVELLTPGHETGEIGEQHRHLTSFADQIGRCGRCGRRILLILEGWSLLRTQQGDRVEQLPTVTDQADAELLQVLGGEPWQNVRLYSVIAKSLLVLLQTKTAQPSREVHAGSPPLQVRLLVGGRRYHRSTAGRKLYSPLHKPIVRCNWETDLARIHDDPLV